MNEKAKKYVDLFRRVKIAAAATVDAEGHPQARIINVMLAEDDGMYIVTSRGKPFYKQLVETGEIALAAMCPDCQSLKFTGKLRVVDKSWVDKVFAQNPGMNEVYPGESRYILDAFHIYAGHGEWFDLLHYPISRETFAYGGDTEVYAQRADWFAGLLQAHIGLALTAIAMSGMIGLLTGIWIAEHPRIAPPVMGVCNVLYTIPAISLLGILIPFSGIGNKTAVIALTVYGIMPMVHNTYVGLTTLDPDILEAARGMGSTGTQALFRVKLPMAAGVILAGVRNMVVMTISVAGIASFVGAGGLGVAVYRGITIYDPAMTAAGSILIALLAIVCDLALGALERYFKKRGS